MVNFVYLIGTRDRQAVVVDAATTCGASPTSLRTA
jgi:hypothetical protein